MKKSFGFRKNVQIYSSLMYFFNSSFLGNELPPGNKHEHINQQDYNDNNYGTVVQISNNSNNKMGGQQETVINVKEQQIVQQQRDTDQQQQQQQQEEQEEYQYQIQNPEDAQVPVVAEAPKARILNRNPFQRSRYKTNELVENNNNQNQDSYKLNQQNGFRDDINHNNNYVSDDNNNNINNIVQNIQKQRVIETKPAMVQPARESNIPSFTVVTALFDLGRGQWKNFRRPLELYLNYSRQLLALEIPIVAYVQPEIADRIWEMRRGKEHLTDVVVSAEYFTNNQFEFFRPVK